MGRVVDVHQHHGSPAVTVVRKWSIPVSHGGKGPNRYVAGNPAENDTCVSPRLAGAVRILLEPSAGHYRNAGDSAMLQVAYRRLREFWPSACIYVITSEPERLSYYCPGAIALPMKGRNTALREPSITSRLGRLLPQRVSAQFEEFECASWQQFPKLRLAALKWRKNAEVESAAACLDVLSHCDLVVATGAGKITDAFAYEAALTLNVLREAKRHGIPAVMLGQGIGPISNPALLARCRSVLPRVDMIALREARTGPALLETLGVSAGRVSVTGDDAIESAYQLCPKQLGSAIGFNLREARYAGTGMAQATWLRRVVQEGAAEFHAPLASVLISHDPSESSGVIQHVLDGHANILPANPDLDPVEGAIRQAGLCRVVLAGSYRSAVFALSQGVSVVGLVNSPYYAAKFEGLEGQFGAGCRHVMLEEPGARETLHRAIRSAWETAVENRPRLLNAAARQIALSQKVYERIPDLVKGTRKRVMETASVSG